MRASRSREPRTPPPQPLERGLIGTEATPDPHGAHPFYCPICMMSFRRALVTSCCNNNVCEVCMAELLEKHVGQAPLQLALRRTKAYREREAAARARKAERDEVYLPDCNEPSPGRFDPTVPLSCPFCTRTVSLTSVVATATPSSGLPLPAGGLRNYHDSPGVVKALQQQQHPNAVQTTPGGLRPPRTPQHGVYSPVKTGDEFQALRRKLRPLGEIDPNSRAGKEHAADCAKKQHGAPRAPKEEGGARAGLPPLRPVPASARTITESLEPTPTSALAARQRRLRDSSRQSQRSPSVTTQRKPKKEKEESTSSSCVVM